MSVKCKLISTKRKKVEFTLLRYRIAEFMTLKPKKEEKMPPSPSQKQKIIKRCFCAYVYIKVYIYIKKCL